VNISEAVGKLALLRWQKKTVVEILLILELIWRRKDTQEVFWAARRWRRFLEEFCAAKARHKQFTRSADKISCGAESRIMMLVVFGAASSLKLKIAEEGADC
jgi:hypothetical protein